MNRTILLVEDDANDVYFMQRAARKARIPEALQVARDGEEAIDYLAGRGAFSDRQRFPAAALMLLDLTLPRITGFEVLGWMRGQPAFHSTIVIVLTSSELGSDVAEAYRLGANSCLSKPPTPDRLPELLSRVYQYWLNLNRPAPSVMSSGAPFSPRAFPVSNAPTNARSSGLVSLRAVPGGAAVGTRTATRSGG